MSKRKKTKTRNRNQKIFLYRISQFTAVLKQKRAIRFFIIVLPLLFFVLLLFYIDYIRILNTHNSLVDTSYPDQDYIGELLISITNIDPNTEIATLDVRYNTDYPSLDDERIQLLIHSGSVRMTRDEQYYKVPQSVLHRSELVMEPRGVITYSNGEFYTFVSENIEIKIDKEKLYPFDSYFIRFTFSLITLNKANPINLSASEIYFELEDPEFINSLPVGVLVPKDFETVILFPNSVSTIIERPTYKKFQVSLTLILLFTIVLWTLWKISQFEDKFSQSLEILGLNIAILLALPDIRSMLVPAELAYAPAVDLFAGLITILSLFVVLIYIFRFVKKDNDD